MKTVPQLSRTDRLETYPSWSPDGKFMYFSSAPMPWPSDEQQVPPKKFNQVKYDLLRIPYDIETDTWSEPETVIESSDPNLSILLPRVSPDGRWLLVCMCDYGCFTAFRPSSDLYLVDLTQPDSNGKFQYRNLEINSDVSESYHSFSSNSKWFVFSSKRRDSVFTRPYISHIDNHGNVSKPFILPQQDPAYYDSLLQSVTVSEFLTEPVKLKGEQFARVIRGNEHMNIDIPVTMASKKADTNHKGYTERE